MKRRGGSRKQGKKRRTNTPKIRKARTARFSAKSPNQFGHLKRERDEALEQQAATAEVLNVISSSPGQLEPVFQTILANATRICGAKFGTLYLRDGDSFRAAAFHNAPPAFIEARKDRLIQPDPGSTLGQAAATKRVAQVLDSTKREAYRRGDPFVVAGADLGGYRTIVSVPMVKEKELIGVISIYRQEVRAFTDKQIELETSPPKPSLLSRTRGCSTNCVSAQVISPRPWSIRLQPAKSSTSLADHQMSYSEFLKRFFRLRDGCARQTMPAFSNCRMESIMSRPPTTPKQLTSNFSWNIQSVQTAPRVLDGQRLNGAQSIYRIASQILNIKSMNTSGPESIALCLESRCCATVR